MSSFHRIYFSTIHIIITILICFASISLWDHTSILHKAGGLFFTFFVSYDIIVKIFLGGNCHGIQRNLVRKDQPEAP